MAQNVFVTKNNCKTILSYDKARFEKLKKNILADGYRLCTDAEVDEHLQKLGYKPEPKKKKDAQVSVPADENPTV